MYKIKHETGNDYWSIFFNGTWIEQFRAKSRSKVEMQGLLNDVNCRMDRYLNPKYKVLTALYGGNYEDCFAIDGKPQRFDSIEDAIAEIKDYNDQRKEKIYDDDFKIVPEWQAPHAEIDEDGDII
ncbi:MAG: hypothetical protein CL489_17745 [Acidobacteria bacterium]|nr:hypothetical protein [Acidobacteriota bacterium]